MFEVLHRSGKWKGLDWYILWQDMDSPSFLYSPNLGLVLEISERMRDAIVAQQQLPRVITKHFEAREGSQVFPMVERPKAFHLALGLTRNCTLYCVYCHAEADKDLRTDHEYVELAIEHAFKEAGKTPRKVLSVSFAVGGEPTMNWPEFTRSIERIRELEAEKHHGVEHTYISMTTNCYYGYERRRFVAEKLDKLTLSLDGDRDVQDKHRPTRSGKGSYDLVSETVRYFLSSEKVDAGIRVTASDYSVKRMPEIIEAFYQDFGGDYTVAFEPMIAVGRGKTGFFGPPSNEEFATAFWRARERGNELGIRVITSAANVNRLIGRYCGAMAIPSFTVCSNGEITACHRDQEATDYGYGRIDRELGGIIVDDEKIEANVALTEVGNNCEPCPVKWHCAGDCPDLRKVGYSRCDINLFLLYRQLAEKISSTKGQ